MLGWAAWFRSLASCRARSSLKPPPSKWPGETHRDRLKWFIDRSTLEADVEHVRRWGVNILSRATPEAAERIMSMQWDSAVDWATELPRWRIPTLLLHGEKDFACNIETQRYINSLIPDSKLVVFEGSGHIPAMTRPLHVAAEINAFFGAKLGPATDSPG